MSTLSRSIVLAVVAAALAGAQPAAGQRAQPGPLRLVFESNRTGTWQVYSVPASGGVLAQLTFAAAGSRNPRPAPDGRTLLVERAGGLWLLRADGAQPRRLVAGRSAAWTRDGRRFAYVGPAARPGIHVYELRTRRWRRVTSNPRDAQPSWSPDGRSLLFLRGGSAIVRRGGAARTVAAGATNAAWSPDGRWIAYTARPSGESGPWTLVVVRPDGRDRRVLVPATGGSGVFAWSPDSRHVALAGVAVIEVATGRWGGPGLGSTVEAAWAPRGDELAVLRDNWPRTDLLALPFAGGGRTLLRGGVVDDQRSVAWTRPPRGTRFRPAQPASPLQVATPRELRSRVPIYGFAADGDRVAYGLVRCGGVSSWRPGGTVAGTVDSAQCPADGDGGCCWIALAGERIAYGVVRGGNSKRGTVYVSHVDTPWPGVELVTSGLDITGSPLVPRLGYLLGDGPLLVFSTWTLASPPSCVLGPLWLVAELGPERAGILGDSCIASQTVWRADASAAPEAILTGTGSLEPISLDRGRVVLRRADGSIAVVDEHGRTLFELSFEPREAVAAELAGPDLVVLVPGELRHYDAGSGQLLRTWPLPSVPAGGFCGLWSACDSLDQLLGGRVLVLEDLARGIVAYRLHGELRLLRLRDGAEAPIGPALSARLEDEGLFYSYRGDETWPGRIRFVPFDELPVRP